MLIFRTKLKIYFNWLLVNVLFCLLPLVISIAIIDGINDSIISSFVAYCFTLLITSLYIFDRVRYLESSLKWIGFFLAFILLTIYIYYPNLSSTSQKEWIVENKIPILTFILLFLLFLSFVMNLPSFRCFFQKKIEENKFKKAKKDSNKFDKMIEKNFKHENHV